MVKTEYGILLILLIVNHLSKTATYYICRNANDMNEFLISLLHVVCEMAPYLLLGFLIAGVLHVFVPQGFYRKYLSRDNKLAVLWAALLGVPLPLCSCGVIPTAIGLRNEKASKGAVASFLIATPQTGIDSILATFSLMGLGFAVIRPVAALITGVCGGLLVNRLVPEDDAAITSGHSCNVEGGNKIWRVLKYAYFKMIQDIGGRLVFGLLVNAVGITVKPMAGADPCCAAWPMIPSTFKLVCASVLTLLILFALIMKLFERFGHKADDPDTAVYTVEGMHCSHCEAAVCRAVEDVPGVESAKANASRKTLTIKGPAAEDDIRAAVENAGYTFKGTTSA